MNRVFVSYSRRNKGFAERLARDLSDAGLEVWIDFRQIHAGEYWQDEILRGIERSEIIVVCLSPDAVVSDWVQREVNTGHDLGKFIIPVMAVDALVLLRETENMRWLLDVHFIDFQTSYEDAFPELLRALPGKRRVNVYDEVDAEKIPNPFKGLEAFQQTDAPFFFGREGLVKKSLQRLRQDRPVRFLAVVGASGSGKSSLVRAGVIPQLRNGALPGSDQWRIMIFTPGNNPIDALAQRLAPLIENRDSSDINALLRESPQFMDVLAAQVLDGAPDSARVLMVVDQFEEVFTRAADQEARAFLTLLQYVVKEPGGRVMVVITMRADFFDRLSLYPQLAEIFEQENMVIATEMTPDDLLRSIVGPAEAVGLVYDEGLPQQILEEVRRQPGSLPLLQYALKELYNRRDGNRLTSAAYEEIGGVRRALARHAEDIYVHLNAAQQAIMRRILLRLIEVNETGEATRRKVDRRDLDFRDVPDEAIQELIEQMTAAQSRLLIASREITSSEVQPTVWIEVGHEALIREWDRFKGWVADNKESLRYGSELLQSASDWRASGRDKAYLLTGNRLMRAEEWLDEADASAIQREFIQESIEENDRQTELRQKQIERELTLQRQSATRLRGFVVVLVLGLVVSIILAFLTLDSQAATEDALATAEANEQRARESEQRAQENADQALSLALAASANRAYGDNDLELAVMLAVYANGMVDAPPPQSQRTLAQVAYAPGTIDMITVNSEVNDAAYDPVNKQVLITVDDTLMLWNPTTDETAIWQQDYADEIILHAVAFSPDGTLAASGDEAGEVLLWDVATGTVIDRFNGHSSTVNVVEFSPDGTALLSGGDDDLIIQWTLATHERRAFNGHSGDVNAVDYRADGAYFVSGSDDETARVWEAATGISLQLTGHQGNVNAVAYDPQDPTYVISGSDDDTVIRWNTDTGDMAMVYSGHEGDINRVAYSPDGDTLISASADRTLIWWNEANAEVLDVFGEHTDEVVDVDLDTTGEFMLTLGGEGAVRLWDIVDAQEISRIDAHKNALLSRGAVAAYTADDQLIVSGGADGVVRMWETATGTLVREFIGHTNRVNAVDISANGQQVLSGASDGTVILWDVASETPVFVMETHDTPVMTVRFLPDSRRAISGDFDGGLILWDLSDGLPIRRYGPVIAKDDIGHTDTVYDVAIHPDGQLMLSASEDGTLLLWNIADGSIVRQYKGHNAGVRAVKFHPSGDFAVSGGSNGTLVFWDVRDDPDAFGGVLRRINAHDGDAVTGVDFDPTGTSVISGGKDRTLRVWDWETGFEMRRYTPDTKVAFLSVDFSNSGLAALTGMDDSSVRVWRVLVQRDDLMTWTRENRFIAEPTCEQRELFSLEPLCEDGRPAPTATPFPLSTPTPQPEPVQQQSAGWQ